MKLALLRCSNALMKKMMKDWEGKKARRKKNTYGEMVGLVWSLRRSHSLFSQAKVIEQLLCKIWSLGHIFALWVWEGKIEVGLEWMFCWVEGISFDVQERRNGWEGTIRVGWGLSIVVVIVMWVSSWWLWERKKERLTWKL